MLFGNPSPGSFCLNLSIVCFISVVVTGCVLVASLTRPEILCLSNIRPFSPRWASTSRSVS